MKAQRANVALFLAILALAACHEPNAPRHAAPPPQAADAGADDDALDPVTADAAPLVPRIIAPQATDAAIDWVPATNPQFNHHFVWLDPARESNGKLLVFLPGTGGRPRGYQRLEQEAARLGYHVIGLMYQNSFQNNLGVIEACRSTPDPDCTGNTRLEVIDGVDHSSVVDVNQANSIDNRLTKLLLYLDAQYPDEGWSRFLDDGEPRWSQIAVAGHSQGAGHAALIGKIRHVYRVIMFGGPADDRVSGQSDAWISIGKTPAAKYFELFHLRDHFGPGIRLALTAFGLQRFGDPVTVETSEPPYGGTHVLVTDLEPQGGYVVPNPHLSEAVDAQTPLDPDGTPALRDAWRYLLGAPDSAEEDDLALAPSRLHTAEPGGAS